MKKTKKKLVKKPSKVKANKVVEKAKQTAVKSSKTEVLIDKNKNSLKNTRAFSVPDSDGKSNTVYVKGTKDVDEEDSTRKKSVTVYGGLKPRAVEDGDNDI